MARKTLSISKEAYDALARVKSRRESFTDVILRLTAVRKKRSLLEYVKSLKPDEELAGALERILEKKAKLRLARSVSLLRKPYSKHQEEAQSFSAKTDQTKDKIADLIARLHARFNVDKALLFGSTARGSRLQESDIDLIVVSKGFEEMSVPERQGAVQVEWNHSEDLEALTYTPAEFSKVSTRLTMREILSYAVDVSPLKGGHFCPKCGRKGSLQTKIVKNSAGRSYPFLYFAHYARGKIHWCYLGPLGRFRAPQHLRIGRH